MHLIYKNISRYILVLSAITTIFIVGLLLLRCSYGYDFTDEGYYLNWISSPQSYPASITQFGFVYHPLYKLLGGNISVIRQLNLVILFVLSWVIVGIILRNVFSGNHVEKKFQLIISGAIATSSLIFYKTWLPTPNYNSLNFESLLVVSVGFLLASKETIRASIIGWFLIGAGGALVFLAKISSAILLAPCIIILIILAQKFNAKLFLFSVATAIIMVVSAAFLIDGSLLVFIKRMQDGVELTKLIGSNYSFTHSFRLGQISLDDRVKLCFLLVAAILAFAVICYQSKNLVLLTLGMIFCICCTALSLAMVFGLFESSSAGPFDGLLILGFPCAAILACLWVGRSQSLFKISRYQISLALYFLALPYIYTFGTNNNYWSSLVHADFFWAVLGGVLLIHGKPENVKLSLVPFAFGVQLISIYVIQQGLEFPYRQPHSLYKNTASTTIGIRKSNLILSTDFSRYITEGQNLTLVNGFREGTPVIDLSGQSPGLLYAIGAKSIAQGWMIGGYPGSNEVAQKTLRRVSCEELAVSWVLTEPEGARKLSNDLLSSYGANIDTDFYTIGSLKTAEGAGDDKKIRTQFILKPNRSIDNARKSCQLVRQLTS